MLPPFSTEENRTFVLLLEEVEALREGCTELLQHRAWLHEERQRLLHQRIILLERRRGLLEQLQEQKRWVEHWLHWFPVRTD